MPMAGEPKCKVCGSAIPYNQTKCPLCGTDYERKEGKVKAKISVEKRAAETLEIDITDPKVRQVLEELTLIPGVSKKGALILYKKGVRSTAEFIKKAMPGEARGDNYARILANRLAIDSAKSGKKAKERRISCPSCRSPNKLGAKKCGVCGAQIAVEADSVDAAAMREKLAETVKEYFGEFAESEEFGALPGDMKAEIATVLGSDAEMTEAEAKRVASTLTSLPQEMAEAFDEMALQDDSEPSEEDAKEEKAHAEKDVRKLKKREILVARLEKWRKMGFDVSELEPLVDGDFDTFKAKAKEILAAKKMARSEKKPGAPNDAEKRSGRAATPEEKAKFLKQIESWQKKGFGVEGLAELLDTDMDEFKARSMKMLKSQMKK